MLAVLIVFAITRGNVSIAIAGRGEPSLRPPSRINKAPLDFRLLDLRTDSTVMAHSFAGKAVLLNFRETGCQPCRTELPTLNRLYQRTRDTSIMFAIISSQEPEIAGNDSILRQSSLPFYHLGSPIPDVFRADILPRTYILNPRGEIVVEAIGAENWDAESVVKYLDSLKRVR